MTRTLKFFVVILGACLCQTNLSAVVRVGTVAPNFIVAVLTALTTVYGTYGGFCSGLLSGMLYDSAVGYVPALNLVAYALVGFAVSGIRRTIAERFSKLPASRAISLFLTGLLAAVLRESIDVGYLFLIGAEFDWALLYRMIIGCGLTALLVIPLALLFEKLFRQQDEKSKTIVF